ncbi:MAG: aminotransferase class I/II-fold pyridoxal phosphate-dependent enzyme [Candidatus Zixiibacteriota bacterium]
MPLTRKILLDSADRMQRLPVPGDADMERIARRLTRLGVEIIDLSDLRSWVPDLPTGRGGAPDPDAWKPATTAEMGKAKELISNWYSERFGVSLNPETEIDITPTVQSAVLMIALAYIDVGDVTLIPDPGPTFYRAAAVLAGGGVIPYHLYERNDYLPNFEGLQEGLMGRSRLMVLSYPHNPTSAVADLSTLTQAVVFARRNNILITYDSTLALAERGPIRPRSFLEASGARNVGVEVFAPGILLGDPSLCPSVVAGNREVVASASFLQRTCGVAYTRASIQKLTEVLVGAAGICAERLRRLDEARHILVEAFTGIGGSPRSSPTVPFLWASIPSAVGAEGYCRRVLRRTGIRLAPGTAFGERGEGYIRAAIPDNPDVARAVAERLIQHARLNQRRLPRARVMGRKRPGGKANPPTDE